MGHEMIGATESAGADIRTLWRADVVIMPLVPSEGICIFCHEGLPTGGVHLRLFGNQGKDGAQGGGDPHSSCRPGTARPPAREGRRPDASFPEPLPEILEGRIQPGRVFDRVVDLDGVPGGYPDMS
jgi:threonine dehydrogenase-like Zn-dependent dehydrogenase